MIEASSPLADILAAKKAKLADLRGRGVECYPSRTVRTHGLAELLPLAAPLAAGQPDAPVAPAAGRLVALREMGKTIFAHLEDGTARCQLYFRKDDLPADKFALIKSDLHVGDFLGATGSMFKTKTGEPTLAVKNFSLLAKSLRPMPEKWHGLKDVETRYRSRHLDLMSSADVRKMFAERSLIVSTVRKTMDALGFMEVETPILLHQAGGASARPFETHHNALGRDMALRIATELYLKRLVIGGFERVYEIGRIFRNEGIDTRHNPEFTMLEAYQAYADYEVMAKLFERVVGDCAEALGKDSVEYNGHRVSLKPPFKRLYLPEAWEKYCGEKIENILEGKGFNRNGLLALARRQNVPASDKTPSAKIFERVFDEKILPLLDDITFVFDHPTAITPLAKLKPDGGQGLVERFECFGGRQELANAYTELNDPEDQRERFAEQAKQKQAGDEETDILDEDFVQAMETGMPPMGGIGFGIDRLVMLLTGQTSIREVILFPTLKE